MTMQTDLDRLRRSLPACKLAAFGDLSSQLILRSSSSTTCSREVLDQLCKNAKAVFDALSDKENTEEVERDVFASSAILFDATETQLLARHTVGADDVVLAQIEGGQRIEDALSAVTKLAAHFSEGDQ